MQRYVIAVVAGWAALSCLSVFLYAQGPITPPGAPAAMMKTLDQVEPRIPISGPTFISTSGSYYLTGNISVASGNGIVVLAPDVTLDLNGFLISSATNQHAGVRIDPAAHRCTVKNGHIQNFGEGVLFLGEWKRKLSFRGPPDF